MKKKVLLIDDSMTIHRVIDLSVDEEKYEVEKVFSAEDAEGKIKSFNPDIVLLDNKLEGIKLNEYVSRLKSETGASVILLVGAFDHFNESNLSATNADDFIVKPFNSSLLEEKLEKFGQAVAAEVEGSNNEVEPSVEKDSAVEELLASIDSEETVEKETQFEDFDDLLAENAPSEDLVEDKKQDVELEESLESSESVELEDIFDDVKTEDKTEEDLFDAVLTEEKGSEDLTASESISEDILSDLVEESSTKEDEELEIISEEATTEQKEDSDLSDIFGELEDVKDDEDKDLLEEVPASEADEGVVDSLQELVEEEKVLDEDFDESFDKTFVDEEKSDVNIDENIDAQDVADELTVDMPDEVEFGAELEEKDSLTEDTEIQFTEEDVAKEDFLESVEGEKLHIDKEMIKKVIEDSIDLDFLRDVVREVISKNLEKVIWEIVPDMAEKLIIEEIEKLKKGE
ncbi:response regulator [Deferribacterales bacterium Es71-Z0220]|jgi:DNA-binding response OmpR family regulator|uniref:response regulator n=1 Tax=Deferrivibrio essentukiensis TaxID=2880922 RepID=UPI001F62579C|nr:response regulator [Deferrivibrio essentukiensis]MBZ4672786.1 response regulator receiver [Deferribacteraceae bacterium]MCB4204882.1 response regulator [Deferrivibrio essentukiensis]